MLRRLVPAAALGALAALAIAAPAMASPAHPAAPATPDTGCNAQTSFCNFEDIDGLWIARTGANEAIVGSTSAHATEYQWVLRPSGTWGQLRDDNGNCMNEDAALDEIVTSSCGAFTNGNELWRIYTCSSLGGTRCINSYALNDNSEVITDDGSGNPLAVTTFLGTEEDAQIWAELAP